MTACFVAHFHRLSILSLCLESLRNRTSSNLKLHHISKNPSYNFFWQEDVPPPPRPPWPTGPCANGKPALTYFGEVTWLEHWTINNFNSQYQETLWIKTKDIIIQNEFNFIGKESNYYARKEKYIYSKRFTREQSVYLLNSTNLIFVIVYY